MPRRAGGWALVVSLVLSGTLVGPALARAPVLIHWSRGRVVDVPTRGEAAISGLACPSIRLCVGIDSRGAIIPTAAPATTIGPWRRLPQPWAQGLAAISCPSVHFCVAVTQPIPGRTVRVVGRVS